MHIGGEGQYITKGHHCWKRIGTKKGVTKKRQDDGQNGEKEKGKGKGHLTVTFTEFFLKSTVYEVASQVKRP